MKKFTVFTIILTVIVVIVFSETIARDYLPMLGIGGEEAGLSEKELTLPDGLDLSKSIQTDSFDSDVRLGDSTSLPIFTDIDISKLGDDDFLPVDDVASGPIDDGNIGSPLAESAPVVKTTPKDDSIGGGLKDFEDEDFVAPSVSVYLRDEQLKSAGFTSAYLEEQAFDGYLFKNILVNDLHDVEIEKTLIRSKDLLFAKVYIFKAGIESDINEVYQLIKLRSSEGLNVDINETNQYAAGSFYMNDPSRSNTAFLTIRIGAVIYAFSYPKEYHAQIKNLIQLIEWELG